MCALISASDTVHWYMNELTSRIIAKTGIPTDRHHIGKLILQGLKDAPDHILQIDAATDKSETFKSVLERSVKCAIAFKKLGLKRGDVMVVLATNHLDVAISLYAALYLGIYIAPLDITLGVLELKEMFQVNQAKLILCHEDKVHVIKEALENVGLDADIITFDGDKSTKNFSVLLAECNDVDTADFKPTDFDPKETICLLTSTSGTTGLPKVASLTHQNLVLTMTYMWSMFYKFPTPTKRVFIASSLQWLSAHFFYLFSPILRFTRVQTSAKLSPEHFVEIVNKYKPTYTAISPTLMTTLFKHAVANKVDLSSFEYILMGGSAVPQKLLDEIKAYIPHVDVRSCYGLSEAGGLTFINQNPVRNSVGRPMGLFDYKLVSVETNEDIKEPFINGELWVRGPSIGKGYYNNPEITKEMFLKDGWLKTGDIFYRDENFSFYFVERLKLILKYKNNQLSPQEIEKVILKHPGVVDVIVIGIPDQECGDLPVACVIRKPGHTVTAQEIKELVKDTLSDPKQLRGGVIFLKEFPLTATTKVHRQQLKQMALTMERE